jgi:hypothetical protein
MKSRQLPNKLHEAHSPCYPSYGACDPPLPSRSFATLAFATGVAVQILRVRVISFSQATSPKRF